ISRDVAVEEPGVVTVTSAIAQRFAVANPKPFDHPQRKLRAKFRRLFAVKLQRVDAGGFNRAPDKFFGWIHEHANLRDERRQLANDFRSALRREIAPAVLEEHK